MPFYPKLTDDQIMTMKVVIQSLEKDAKYLEHPDCPYTDTIKKFFTSYKNALASQQDTPGIFEGIDEMEVVDSQLHKLISEMDAMGNQIAGFGTSEKLAFFRTKTSLIEKLLGMRERVFSLKQMSEFRDVIIETLDDICTKDQITEFMHRLDGVLGMEKSE